VLCAFHAAIWAFWLRHSGVPCFSFTTGRVVSVTSQGSTLS
jgi:hypothetical protein